MSKNKKFEGFEQPNYTMIPNDYLEYTISPDCDLSLVDMRIMNLFIRNTFGWQKSQYGMVLSISDIQAILNIKNRNQVSDSLKTLTGKNFLERKKVRDLSVKQRANIERRLEKQLKANQFIYRIKFHDNPLSWDVVVNTEMQIGKEKVMDLKEQFHSNKDSNENDTSSENGTSNKNDIGTIYKNDTGTIYKSDTSQGAESLDSKGDSDSVKKGLKKGLKKEEEEEEENENLSELVQYLISKEIKKEDALIFESNLLVSGINEYTFDDVLKAINLSLQDKDNGICKKPYSWAVGKLKRLIESKKTGSNKKNYKSSNSNRGYAKNIIPDWYKEGKHKEKPERKDTGEMSEEQKKVAEILKEFS